MTGQRIPVSGDMLQWAINRSGHELAEAEHKFPMLELWLSGEQNPTLKQFKEFAAWTHTPGPLLLLHEPPRIELPIADFRAGRTASPLQPSTELLDTIHLCQRRQAWFEDYAERAELPGFQGRKFEPGLSIVEAAARLRSELNYDVADRTAIRNSEDARRHLIGSFEDLGGLVVVNGVVGNGTHRILNTDEFRGFTLNSDMSPLVFINGADSKNGQLFSLAHEFAHVWRGDTGVSSEEPSIPGNNDVERWCNQVAAEFLVPAADLRNQEVSSETIDEDVARLARYYGCSTLVIIIRLRELSLMDKQFLSELYERELRRLKGSSSAKPLGGNFHANQRYRIGRRFGEYLFRETAAGRTSFTDAMRLSNLNRGVLERYLTGDRAA